MGEGGLMEAAGIAVAYFIVSIVVLAVMVVSYWKIFVKAGKPGWAAIVPIYNIIVLLEIVYLPYIAFSDAKYVG